MLGYPIYQDEDLDNKKALQELQEYYQVIWDETQTHKFKKISQHLQTIKAFKNN